MGGSVWFEKNGWSWLRAGELQKSIAVKRTSYGGYGDLFARVRNSLFAESFTVFLLPRMRMARDL